MIVVDVMAVVSELIVMIMMADVDGGRYVDENDENLVSVVVTMAAVAAEAVEEALS